MDWRRDLVLLPARLCVCFGGIGVFGCRIVSLCLFVSLALFDVSPQAEAVLQDLCNASLALGEEQE